MRYFVIDYESVKYTYYQLQGMEQLTEQDTVRILFPDKESRQEFENLWQEQCGTPHLLTDILPENTVLCRISMISFLLGSLCATFSSEEVILLAGNEHYCSVLREYQKFCDNLFVYSSFVRYFKGTWKRERNKALNLLELPDGQKEKVGFWVRRAYCISDSGRRKYRTHNRIQEIVGNGQTLKKVYQAVKPFLE